MPDVVCASGDADPPFSRAGQVSAYVGSLRRQTMAPRRSHASAMAMRRTALGPFLSNATPLQWTSAGMRGISKASMALRKAGAIALLFRSWL